MRAANAPCTTRAATKRSPDADRLATSEAIVKPATPIRNVR
jgi:hypothetical protein